MRILHLEDNAADVARTRALLIGEWPDCEIRAVATREAYLQELQAGGHDLILSAFTLPGFDGLSALQLALAHRRSTPFVFLSGTIGEERAVEAVRAGAADYVNKDRIQRLVTAVVRVLRDQGQHHERRLAESDRRTSEENYRTLFEQANDGICIADRAGRLVDVNLRACDMLGYARAEFLGKNFADFILPEDHARMQAGLARLAKGSASVNEYRFRRKDGTILIGETSTKLLPDGRLLGLLRDVTGRYAAENRIREQAELLNQAHDAIIVTDLDGRISFWNRGAEKIYGWTAAEAIGQTSPELFGPANLAALTPPLQAAAETGEWRGELRLYNRQGQPINVKVSLTSIMDDHGQVRARLGISTDITANKALEEQFFRAQRLESIGLLAAGIAHDLNNMLAPVLMGTSMLRQRITDPGDTKLLVSMEKSAARGAGLVRQILGFAHGVGGQPQTVRLKHLAHDIIAMIEETFPKSITFEHNLPSDLWMMVANPTQIHQVLLNLCVNARDAMPRGGRLSLRGKNVVLDEHAAAAIKGAQPGRFLVMEVSDTGTGIPADVLEHIWEPFFSTKGADAGTGLGLLTVRGIVERHSGFIELETEVGRGTTFRVYVPADETSAPASSNPPLPSSSPRGQGELILVVDDEADIREVINATLAGHGYRVLVAGDGLEAVALFAPRSAEIKLVITDLNMPGLEGGTLAIVLRRLDPKVRLLAMSGMLPGKNRADPLPEVFRGALMAKPFSVETLLKTVRQHLPETAAEPKP
jgi:two-component system cell cycle sensor histidine kinase/response regulator CckA